MSKQGLAFRPMPETATTSDRIPVNAERDLAVGRRVLDQEAEGLKALARALDVRFSDAVEILAAVGDRIVVTGMGKSGHIARKIAATLASTGSPAMFVHPGEASHGDLGMITPKDAVLALSNSGETVELTDLVAYTRRFAIPLIAVAGRPESSLVEAADVALLLPAAEEACPMGLAPTTSTAMMLALGDALALALLERKGFTADDFRVLHPGGRLGTRLVKVGDIMHKGEEVPTVTPATPMAEAIIEMSGKRFGCVGVIDEAGRLMGVITDGDLRRHMAPTLLARRAEELMTRGAKTIRSNALAGEAVKLMNTSAITSLFVVDGQGRPEGILHIHDCLHAGVA